MSNKEVIQAMKLSEAYTILDKFYDEYISYDNKVYEAIRVIQTLYKNKDEVTKADETFKSLGELIELSMELLNKEVRSITKQL